MNLFLWERWLIGDWPFCHVIAGRGAPEVSQCKMMDMPSITALSEGPAVMFGAIPVAEKEASETHMYIFKNQTHTELRLSIDFYHFDIELIIL